MRRKADSFLSVISPESTAISIPINFFQEVINIIFNP